MRSRPRRLPLALGLATFALSAAFALGGARAQDEASAPPPPEPSDYRMDGYRTATPLTLQGARVASTKEAETLWRNRTAVFIDTMPRDRHPPNLPPGTVWRDKPREHIPGSAWLANVGYGVLAPDMDAYFRSSLTALAKGAREKPILFYCRMDCWMSWNAAKRAMEWGFQDVIWYPEGTDGWAAAGLPLETATPYQATSPSQ